MGLGHCGNGPLGRFVCQRIATARIPRLAGHVSREPFHQGYEISAGGELISISLLVPRISLPPETGSFETGFFRLISVARKGTGSLEGIEAHRGARSVQFETGRGPEKLPYLDRLFGQAGADVKH